ncbi:amidohydrolase family protein [Streptomyces sp. NPDC001307]|uniref:amidohydrolase family protein n=1 Tax=Streptomyces sp. NPDC001307 TaxID=3364560 RepID=UPI00367EFB1C
MSERIVPTTPSGGVRSPIDSHVHFWDPRRLTYPWLRAVPRLNRPFTPHDLAVAAPEPVDVVFVEAGRAEQQALDELEWVRSKAKHRPWIRGVVAHAPLEDPSKAAATIREYVHDPLVVGVRRNVQDEPAGFTTSDDFRAGVRLLGEAGLPFDACVRRHQMPELAELAEACPQTLVVLDHLGKPSPEDPGTPWRQAMRRLARQDNVVCKLSGLTTEAAPDTSPEVIVSLLREALEIFGPDRCLYGSDWPVMTQATQYATWLELVRTALAAFPGEAADAVLHANAVRTYRLDRLTVPSPPGPREEPE